MTLRPAVLLGAMSWTPDAGGSGINVLVTVVPPSSTLDAAAVITPASVSSALQNQTALVGLGLAVGKIAGVTVSAALVSVSSAGGANTLPPSPQPAGATPAPSFPQGGQIGNSGGNASSQSSTTSTPTIIGAVVGVLALVSLGGFFYYRSHGQRHQVNSSGPGLGMGMGMDGLSGFPPSHYGLQTETEAEAEEEQGGDARTSWAANHNNNQQYTGQGAPLSLALEMIPRPRLSVDQGGRASFSDRSSFTTSARPSQRASFGGGGGEGEREEEGHWAGRGSSQSGLRGSMAVGFLGYGDLYGGSGRHSAGGSGVGAEEPRPSQNRVRMQSNPLMHPVAFSGQDGDPTEGGAAEADERSSSSSRRLSGSVISSNPLLQKIADLDATAWAAASGDRPSASSAAGPATGRGSAVPAPPLRLAPIRSPPPPARPGQGRL